jgi:hypothetical protein
MFIGAFFFVSTITIRSSAQAHATGTGKTPRTETCALSRPLGKRLPPGDHPEAPYTKEARWHGGICETLINMF